MAFFRVLTNRRVLISIAVIAVLIAIAMWPKTIDVDVTTVSRGPVVLTVDEEGRTRVRDRFVVAAPVAGRVLRIELEPGDKVKSGMVVARIQPEQPPLLDARSRAEAEAAIESARAALGRARAEEQRARAALDQAQRELARTRELIANELTTARELEARAADVRAAEEAVNADVFAVRAAGSELARAEARLAPAPVAGSGRVVTVTSPVDGLVLKRVRESETVVPAGDPLLEIGDPQRLEIVADLLSTDAVRVKPGARAMIDQWGGNRTLDGRVKRVEPSGFTKISALGVEEQRVNVILDFADPAEAWAALGDGYRVEVRIVVWESPSVLRVPTSTLFRSGDKWATYSVDAGRAHLTSVEIGHQTGQEAEILSGLAEGARIIVHPSDAIADTARVRERVP
jgi:HlyD family secretion protein